MLVSYSGIEIVEKSGVVHFKVLKGLFNQNETLKGLRIVLHFYSGFHTVCSFDHSAFC